MWGQAFPDYGANAPPSGLHALSGLRGISGRAAWRRDGRCPVLHRAFDHFPKVGRVLMLVYGHGVLDCRFQQFCLAVGA